jgi:hypothetical protein
MDCGKKVDRKKKESFGMWQGKCDMCGEEKMVADAQHDFGYYNNEQEKIEDKVQDLI